MKLRSSSDYSNKVCIKCASELQSFSKFRLNLISKQQQLYECLTISQNKIQDVIEIEPHVSGEYDNIQDVIKLNSIDIQNKRLNSGEFDNIHNVIKLEPIDIENEQPIAGGFDNIMHYGMKYNSYLENYTIVKILFKTFYLDNQYEEIETPEAPILPKNILEQTKKQDETQIEVDNRMQTMMQTKKLKKNGISRVCSCFYKKQHISAVHLKQKRMFCDFCRYFVEDLIL